MNLSNGLLLDPRTGRPEGHPSHVEDREGLVWSWAHPDIDLEETLQGAPSHVLESLDKARTPLGRGVRAGGNTWEEVLYRSTADSTAVTNTTTEGDMLTAVDVPVLPAKYLYAGRLVKFTLFGRVSTVVTTPGTITFRLRYGTLAAGTVVLLSKAQRPKTTVSTTMAALVEMTLISRGDFSAAAPTLAWGQNALANTIGDAQAVQESLWPDTPAAVNIDSTASAALRPTIQFSVATATTSWTTHAAFLESKN
jgi:hypothetical protein